uniref:autotransporter domain-containing protein n=1 Tax=Sandarakinorhabdus sp. TaxID=1916663 RepID=UPI00286DA4AB
SFTETGAGPLSLSLDSNTQTAATNTAKLGVDYVIPSGEGAWRIGASAGYVSQLGASDLTLTGRFAGGGNPFILTADAIRSSETQFGAHGAYSGPGWVAIVGYDRRQAGGYVGQSISATFRLVL